MEHTILEKAQAWLNADIDADTKEAIQNLVDNDPKELQEAFYQDLEFGTGGLRGIMGVGSNRMNKYTVGMATQGLSNYLNKTFSSDQISVAIAHDSRNNSRYFAEVAANVFSANGIRVYLFEALRPTPELSFAIRHLDCKSGVVVTASHNPKEYNGYKAYWEDGAQVVPPHDRNIMDEVKSISAPDQVNFSGDPEHIIPIGKKVDEAYLKAVEGYSLSPDINRKHSDLRIVFSSIHGTGITLIPTILDRFGFKNITIIAEQQEPDGNFPTVVFPNPEEAEAMSLALNMAKTVHADLIMATDPDADRVGIGVQNKNGEYQLLNGNQTGALLFYYFLKRKKELGQLRPNHYTVNTIVSSDLLNAVSEGLGVKVYETLTGFKNIAALIREKEHQEEYLIGGEESYGYLIGEFVRDKDAIASCAFLAEMTAYYKEHGLSLMEALVNIYREFGYYKEQLISITRKGMDGQAEIKSMMEAFRKNPPKTLAGSPVNRVLDYQHSLEINPQTEMVKDLRFDQSNVLQFFTEDGTKVSARPSGTEPKIKFYFSVKENLSNPDDYESVSAQLDNKINTIAKELGIG
jgi:phosphoglucomutase